ncbi:amidase, partial [Gammaproteobacteria bacterium]|nr:amidase [Gammaproteobacteria bacterium]
SGVIAALTQPGPMAKTVDDLIYLLEIMAGPDNIDPRAVPCPLLDPYAINVAELKIGYHTDNGIKTPDEAIVSTIISVVDLLKAHEMMISEVRPSGIEMAGLIFDHLLAGDNNDMIKMLLEDSQTITPSPVITRLLEGAGAPISGPEYSQVINLWHNFQSSMLSYFDEFDILVSPVNAHTAIGHDEQEDFSAYSYTTAYNLTGWPSVVIRAGTDPDGLPVGIQILARPFREDQCLATAAWLEAQLGQFSDAMPTRNLN